MTRPDSSRGRRTRHIGPGPPWGSPCASTIAPLYGHSVVAAAVVVVVEERARPFLRGDQPREEEEEEEDGEGESEGRKGDRARGQARGGRKARLAEEDGVGAEEERAAFFMLNWVSEASSLTLAQITDRPAPAAATIERKWRPWTWCPSRSASPSLSLPIVSSSASAASTLVVQRRGDKTD